MAYQLKPSAAASARLCAASDSSARLWPIQPATASTATKTIVAATAIASVRDDTAGGGCAWLCVWLWPGWAAEWACATGTVLMLPLLGASREPMGERPARKASATLCPRGGRTRQQGCDGDFVVSGATKA